MNQKILIEASCIYNIHIGEKWFCGCCKAWRFASRLDSDRLENLKCIMVCKSVLLLLQRRKDKKKILFMWSKFNFLHLGV